jgi:hypothetical protein
MDAYDSSNAFVPFPNHPVGPDFFAGRPVSNRVTQDPRTGHIFWVMQVWMCTSWSERGPEDRLGLADAVLSAEF